MCPVCHLRPDSARARLYFQTRRDLFNNRKTRTKQAASETCVGIATCTWIVSSNSRQALPCLCWNKSWIKKSVHTCKHNVNFPAVRVACDNGSKVGSLSPPTPPLFPVVYRPRLMHRLQYQSPSGISLAKRKGRNDWGGSRKGSGIQHMCHCCAGNRMLYICIYICIYVYIHMYIQIYIYRYI